MEPKISVVVTVKNDEVGLARLKESLDRQTIKPDEVIVIRAEEYRDCSRGKGRNIGIRMAKNEVIAVTDAGCRPHRDWLEKFYKCYKSYKYKEGEKAKKEKKDEREGDKIAVAGWYRAAAETELQRVMEAFLAPTIEKEEKEQKDKREEGNTLPASRSIMFTKRAWEAVGGYPEEAVSGAEDLEFARRLMAHPEVKMIYCPEAVVDWDGPKTMREFFRDIVKHTRGNVEVGYWPHLWRNATVVGRWLAIGIWPWLGLIYLGWILGKGIKMGGIRGIGEIWGIWRWLAVQVAADAGVIWGLTLGILGRLGNIIHR